MTYKLRDNEEMDALAIVDMESFWRSAVNSFSLCI